MYTLFASDLHLNAERPDKIKLFEDFINVLDDRCEALYLLGDIFEFWHGDDDRTKDHQQVIDAITLICEKNIPVFIQKGNRDFLLGKKFEKDTGSKLLPDPYCVDLYGSKTLIMHGDLLCTDDHAYQQFRRYMHNVWLQRLYTTLPLAVRRKISKKIRMTSIEKSQYKSEDIMDVNQQTVNEYLDNFNVSEIIHGHTHRANHHQWELDKKIVNRYVLGDWYQKESILWVNEHKKELLDAKKFIGLMTR